jgi:hypothetical protein
MDYSIRNKGAYRERKIFLQNYPGGIRISLFLRASFFCAFSRAEFFALGAYGLPEGNSSAIRR